METEMKKGTFCMWLRSTQKKHSPWSNLRSGFKCAPIYAPSQTGNLSNQHKPKPLDYHHPVVSLRLQNIIVPNPFSLFLGMLPDWYSVNASILNRTDAHSTNLIHILKMTTSVSARQDIGFQGNRDLLHAVNTHTNLKERVLMDHFKLCWDLIEYDPQILGYSYCA